MKNNFLEANNLFRKYYMWLDPEAKEQAEVVLWLEQNGYTFSMIPNDTYTPGWKQKVKNKILWLRPGLSDLLIVLKRKSLLFLEMKVPKKRYLKKNGELWKARIVNGPSENQLFWKNTLNSVNNVSYEIAYGSKQAISLIEYFEKK